MAIDAKISFLNQIEKQLSSSLTVDAMNQTLRTVSDILEGFDMRETAGSGDEQDDLLDCYIDAMRVQGRSPKTIERYRYKIRKLMKYVQVPTRKITVYHLRGWLSAEKARGIADSTLDGDRQIFSAYFGWLRRESLIERNPAENLGTIRCAKKTKAVYSETDFEKLYRNCKTLRDLVLIHFLGSTGCRISEAMALDRGCLDLERLECIVHGKGNKERRVYFDAVTGMLLREYLEGRKDDNSALFIGLRGERLQPGGVRQMLKVLAKRAGVEHVHPHKFRRTLATSMTRRGMPIQEVASILGHEKLDTTMRYVVLNNDDVKNSYRRYA